MASDESTPNTRAVGAGLNAARHGRSDAEVPEEVPEEVPADTPIVPSAPRDPPSSGRPRREATLKQTESRTAGPKVEDKNPATEVPSDRRENMKISQKYQTRR